MTNPLLFVGLDYHAPEEVADFAEELNSVNRNGFGLKLNLDFVVNSALSGETHPLQRVLKLARPKFVDLKMWNGKRTMASAALSAAKANIDYVNIHAHAGKDFLRGVVDSVKGSNTKVLGLTVLTHYDDEHCQRVYGCSMREAVKRFADIVYEGGCHGVIVPGNCLDLVADLPIEKLAPAVRPDWYGKTGENYQNQETSVREAIEGGANLLACSSPIRKSPDRREALIKT